VVLDEDLNYLDLQKDAYDWERNKQILDCSLGHNDEIILSTVESDFPSRTEYLKSTLYKEIEYLKTFGYTVSTSPGIDSYYRMVPP